MKSIQSATLLMLISSSTVVNGFSIFELQTLKGYSHALLALPKSRTESESVPVQSSRRNVVGGSLAFLATSALPPDPATAKDLKDDYRQGTAALADMDSDAPVPREAYKKLDSGVIIADIFKGNTGGATVAQGSKVNLEWVLRKSNGYFVDSSNVVGYPFIFTVGDGSAIKGVDEGVQGMKVGGVRRLLIPPSLAFVDGLEDGKPGPLPAGFGPRQQMRRVMSARKDVPGEYLYLEVQATRVR